jgi:hypothetical protein
VFSVAQPVWVYSGAPVGDTSIYRYNLTSGLGSADSLTLRHVNGQDSLRLLGISGAPKGIHIYRVDTFPNVNCGLPGMLNNNRYFGLFVIGGTGPGYATKYFFNGNPFVTPVNKPFLQLYDRFCNSTTACMSWVGMNAGMNLNGDTLSKPGMLPVQKEMILAFDNVILPVRIVNFEASWNEEKNAALIHWSVQTQGSIQSYIIERMSENNIWEEAATIKVANESVTDYSFLDKYAGHENYYRIRLTDVSGLVTYSKVIFLRSRGENSLSQLFPNPATDYVFLITDTEKEISYSYKIINTLGQTVKNESNVLPGISQALKIRIQELSPGPYVLEVNIPALQTAPVYKTLIKN